MNVHVTCHPPYAVKPGIPYSETNNWSSMGPNRGVKMSGTSQGPNLVNLMMLILLRLDFHSPTRPVSQGLPAMVEFRIQTWEVTQRHCIWQIKTHPAPTPKIGLWTVCQHGQTPLWRVLSGAWFRGVWFFLFVCFFVFCAGVYSLPSITLFSGKTDGDEFHPSWTDEWEQSEKVSHWDRYNLSHRTDFEHPPSIGRLSNWLAKAWVTNSLRWVCCWRKCHYFPDPCDDRTVEYACRPVNSKIFCSPQGLTIF